MSMLRSIRERKGLTLGQLAARASISARTLTEYEEGRQPIPLSHAKLLAKALWVQIEDLMPPAGSAPPPPRPASPSAPSPAPASAPSPSSSPPPAPSAAPVSQGAVTAAGRPASGAATPNSVNSVGSQAPRAPQAPRVPGDEHRPAQAPMQRSSRDFEGGSSPRYGGPIQRKPAEGRPTRPPRASSPPRSISEGQTEELLRLSQRLEMDPARLDAQLGKPIGSLSHAEAKEWIKRLRDMAMENAPAGKVRYGQWPGSHEDEEAAYLSRQRESGTLMHFKLFDGEEFTGPIIEFTPYTIAIKAEPDGREIVLRKLAIVYYQDTGRMSDTSTAQAFSAASADAAVKHSHPLEETGIDSDRAGDPVTPEHDQMDEDRGV